MGYLLDTNALSDVIRNPAGRVAARLEGLPVDQVCTSIIVAAELRFGAAKQGKATLLERVEGVLSRIRVVPLEVPFDEIYGGLRAELERRGKMIGALDTLIAAHALTMSCTLVTANLREFSRVPGLQVENWGAE